MDFSDYSILKTLSSVTIVLCCWTSVYFLYICLHESEGNIICYSIRMFVQIPVLRKPLLILFIFHLFSIKTGVDKVIKSFAVGCAHAMMCCTILLRQDCFTRPKTNTSNGWRTCVVWAENVKRHLVLFNKLKSCCWNMVVGIHQNQNWPLLSNFRTKMLEKITKDTFNYQTVLKH